MNTILAICCQLALLYAYYAPVLGVTPDVWPLTEVRIRVFGQGGELCHDNKVSLISNGNYFSLQADVLNDGRIIPIISFRLEEFNSFFHYTVFVILNDGSNRVLRLEFADKNEAERLVLLVFATTHVQPGYKFIKGYKIIKLGEADESGKKIGEYVKIRDKPIYLTVFAGLDQPDDETRKRRFIIHGGSENELFVGFAREEFNITPGNADNRFVLVVKSPGDYEEYAYYGLLLALENNSHVNFGMEIPQYTSPDIIVPEALKDFADSL